MRSKDSFRVAFFLRRNVLKNGESPVFMRITVNGQRAENNIQKSILSNLWNQAKERATGTSRTANDLNKFIEEARIKVHAIVTELQQENEPVTAIVVQQRFYGINPKKKKEKTILEVIQAHNDEAETLIGKDYTKTTVYRYKSMKRYLEEMIKKNYEVDDLPLSEFTGEVIRAYEVFLKTEKDLCQNTLIRYMKALKKITNRCIANDWIKKDPFVGIKFKEVPTEPDFLMSAFTGLAFSDVSQLTAEHIVRDNAGNLWIRKHRQKTRQISNIPLLDIPAAILKKYEGNKKAAQKGVLLPVPANQVMNRYLKEIATICKIDKYLTTHCRRHIKLSLSLKLNSLQRFISC